jgi:predicted RNA-binding protein Jag
MKSVLQEAPTIAKAVAKAWDKAGQPYEFSVKVFNVPKRGFFGIGKRSAIVSLSYETSKQINYSADEKKPTSRYRDNEQKQKRQDVRQTKDQALDQRRDRGYRREENQHESGRDFSSWTSDSVKDISLWIKDLVSIMKIKGNFSVSVNKQLLKITFDRPLLPEISDERLLFSSFAYVVMQFLKRKYKKKFRDCRLAITSNRG